MTIARPTSSRLPFRSGSSDREVIVLADAKPITTPWNADQRSKAGFLAKRAQANHSIEGPAANTPGAFHHALPPKLT
jgi:hypothetical protein